MNESGHIGKTEGEFSVCQFLADDTHEYVRRWVSGEEAVEAAFHYTNNVAVRFGITRKVIITDGLDNTVWEWLHGKGVVFGGAM